MAILRQKKILNVIPGTAPQLTVHCSQDDAGSEVAFDLYAGSVPFEPQDAAISVQGVRKDGTGFGPVACTYEGNVVTVTLDATMTGVAGPAVCELTITEEGGTVSTANFALLVEAAAFPHGPIVDDSVDVYQQILAYVQTFAASASADITEKIAEEAAARAAADTAMQGQISAETAARTSADSLLQTEIDQIIAPTGEAPSAAEVQNARIGEDGTVYDTLGNAIRGQVGDLKSALSFYNETTKSANITGNPIQILNASGNPLTKYQASSVFDVYVSTRNILKNNRVASKSDSGMDLVNNGDGTIALNGETTSAITGAAFQDTAFTTLPAGTYELFYKSSEDNDLNIGCVLRDANNNIIAEVYHQDTAEMFVLADITQLKLRFTISNGKKIDHATVYPMIQIKSSHNPIRFVYHNELSFKSNEFRNIDIFPGYNAIYNLAGENQQITYPTRTSSAIDYVSVKDYGAVGDGVTDDLCAIQCALDSGHDVFFPAGIYKISNSLICTQNYITIFGEVDSDQPRAKIYKNALINNPNLLINARCVSVKNLEFRSDGLGTGIKICCDDNKANSDSGVSNCKFYQIETGIEAVGRMAGGFFRNSFVNIRECCYHFYMEQSYSEGSFGLFAPFDGRTIRVIDNIAHANTAGSTFIRVESGADQNTHYSGMIIANNLLHYRCNLLKSTAILEGCTVSGNTLVELVKETTPMPAIYASKMIECIISNNTFIGMRTVEDVTAEIPDYNYEITRYPIDSMIQIVDGEAVHIVNNAFANCQEEPIIIGSLDHSLISGNSFDKIVLSTGASVVNGSTISKSIVKNNVIANSPNVEELISGAAMGCIVDDNIIN